MAKLKSIGGKRKERPGSGSGEENQGKIVGGGNLGTNEDERPRTQRRAGVGRPATPPPIVPASPVPPRGRTDRRTARSRWRFWPNRKNKRTNPAGEPDSLWTRFKKGATKRFRSWFHKDLVARDEARRQLSIAGKGVKKIAGFVDAELLKEHIDKARKAKEKRVFDAEVRAALVQLNSVLDSDDVNAVRNALKAAKEQVVSESLVDIRQSREAGAQRTEEVSEKLAEMRRKRARRRGRKK